MKASRPFNEFSSRRHIPPETHISFNLSDILHVVYLIIIKFCTDADSAAVGACAKVYDDRFEDDVIENQTFALNLEWQFRDPSQNTPWNPTALTMQRIRCACFLKQPQLQFNRRTTAHSEMIPGVWHAHAGVLLKFMYLKKYSSDYKKILSLCVSWGTRGFGDISMAYFPRV